MPATLALLLSVALPQDPPPLRAPSLPLVVHDPYFSIWHPHDHPTDGWSTHWTGREWPLRAWVTIDGEPWRLLGREPDRAPPLPHVGTTVTATRTTFQFADDRIALELAFFSPLLPDDLDVLSRPATYIGWTAHSRDGGSHRLELGFEVPHLICIDRPDQPVAPATVTVDGLDVAGVGSVAQPILAARGDDRRIDWGHAWLAQAAGAGTVRTTNERSLSLRAPLAVDGAEPARHVAILAYDDIRAIRYFDAELPAYWRRRPDADSAWLLRTAWQDRDRLDAAGRDFDVALAAAAERLGGRRYADLCSLAWRQCLGGNKLCADAAGQPLLFPKENFSNGCIATVDVIYPMAPLFLLASADLAKAMLVPVLDYAASPRWRFPFAPHDLGTYPHATGQVYGGGERDERDQMPVEESANLLLLLAALARREESVAFARRWWPQLQQWAEYLEGRGFDPERQLCTDDFTGHLAHNVNLSAKAILALGAFAQLCDRAGRIEDSRRWRGVAERFAGQWLAAAGTGDATRLAFDKPDTWSQKYNLVWDSILDLQLFPAEVPARELAWYRRSQNRYGLPLDSRATFTKIDWTLWSACLTGRRDDFDALVLPVWQWVHETPDRVPLCDWYETQSGRKVNMIARPVVGGFFLRFLQDEVVWRHWFAHGAGDATGWAPLPLATTSPLLATAAAEPVNWRFTTTAPAGTWWRPAFDDRGWQSGPAGFGTEGTPGAIVGTTWNTPAIWLRRTFRLAAIPEDRIDLLVHHDEDATVWINGVLAAELAGYTRDYERSPLLPAARTALRAGDNTLAVHCKQTAGGQFLDVGLVTVRMPGAATAPAGR